MAISQEKRLRVYAIHNGRCGYCLTRWATHVDHLVPRSQGGTDGYLNLVAACDLCGHGKRGRTVFEWALMLASHLAAGARVLETPAGPVELPVLPVREPVAHP